MEFSPEAVLPITDLKVSNEILGVIAGIFLLTSCIAYIFWQAIRDFCAERRNHEWRVRRSFCHLMLARIRNTLCCCFSRIHDEKSPNAADVKVRHDRTEYKPLISPGSSSSKSSDSGSSFESIAIGSDFEIDIM